jgi:hypothetical protein
LVEKFISATGGKEAYRTILSKVTKAEMSFKDQNLKFPIVVYESRDKMYTALDIPSLGKFEMGNDGRVAWERSVMLGPRLKAGSGVGGFLGPEADQLLAWTAGDLTLETVSKEEVNGSPCYQVRFGGRGKADAATLMCFDAQTGYLLKMSGAAAGETGDDETTFSDYRSHEGILTAHHVETKIGGHLAILDIQTILLNGPLPDGVFDLPADVRALSDKREAQRKEQAKEASERPTLHRKN